MYCIRRIQAFAAIVALLVYFHEKCSYGIVVVNATVVFVFRYLTYKGRINRHVRIILVLEIVEHLEEFVAVDLVYVYPDTDSGIGRAFLGFVNVT